MSFESFTPLAGIIGGSLIGGSAGVLLLMNGDIMGISGILSNTLADPIASLKNPKHHWRWVFLGSFAMTVNVYVNYLTPDVALQDSRSTDTDVPIPSFIGHLLGGFLVGVGTKIGNGCTTGHGICGLGRLSPRSLFAVCTFTGTSIITRYLTSPLRSWSILTDILHKSTLPTASPLASALVMGSLALPALVAPAVDSTKSLGAALSGIMFAAGLAVSGMTKNSKVHDFLCFSNFWEHKYDPTLMAVMGSGILSSWLSYQFIKGYGNFGTGTLTCPLKGSGDFSGVPTNRTIDARLMMGAMVFGVGWGLTGICPGPGIYAAAAGIIDAIVGWIPAFLVGSLVGKKIVQEVWETKPAVKKE
mmetsp:Transcript_13600/g.21424  ORF Transcript_13600/g.21424 Transcript_13600/m.21424 type:complete len:359 (+) Transcript_13600:101-1177(+)